MSDKDKNNKIKINLYSYMTISIGQVKSKEQ
jgi:hypothetical protein